MNSSRILVLTAIFLVAVSGFSTEPHPAAVPNSHKPGEVDIEANLKFVVADPASLPGIVMDETAAVLVGSWQYSTHTPPYVGIGYLHDQNEAKGEKSVTWTPDIPEAGKYEVRLSHCHNVRRSTNTPVTIRHAHGETSVRINQQEIPEHRNLFHTLGTFEFSKGKSGSVMIFTGGTEGKYVIADSVQFLPVPSPLPPPVSHKATSHYLDKIKPVLRERCYACHGALKQKAKLRLDTAQNIHHASILTDGELLARITTSDLDERMPPEGEALKTEEIEAIRQWIDAGAPSPENEKADDDPRAHWAFQKIERPPVPPGEFANPIDAFLAAQHLELGLQPQPEAEPTILLRRLHLDLVGLPPTQDQIEDFLQEQIRDPKSAFPDRVDQLLASPHHGERWGRHWMDIWRYSDWYGLDQQLRNSQKHLWHWRDWIIDSLNADKGYDQMVREMLAGDELEPDNPAVYVATGFLARNYYLFNRTTWLDDTIEHTGKAFLGLTLNCAKCHDHKYDPISQKDYYQFRALFEPHQIRLDAIPGTTDFERDAIPRAFDGHPDAETFLHLRGNPADPDKTTGIAPGVPEIFASFASKPHPVELPVTAWAPGVRESFQNDLLAAAEANRDQRRSALEKARASIAAKPGAANPIPDKPTKTETLFADEFDKERPELWKMEGAGWRYQGGSLVQLESTRDKQFARSKTPHPNDFDLTLKFRTTGGDTYKSVGIRFDVTKDGQDAHTVYTSAHAPENKIQIAHTTGGTTTYPPNGKVQRPIKLNQDHTLRVQVRDQLANVSLDGDFLLAYPLPNRNADGAIELFAFDATAEFHSIEIHPLPAGAELQNAGAPAAPDTPTDTGAALKLAEAHFAESEAGYAALLARIAADNKSIRGIGEGDPAKAARLEREYAVAKAKANVLSAEAGKIAAANNALAAAEAALKKNDANYTPLRGSLKALETPEHKESQYPATYSKTSTGRRTALADWITALENPLTARVAVNHIWLRHFGEPIVDSVFDFGRRAKKPELADLLDYLATELIDSGWSMKHLHRLIVTSHAYRRTSSNLHAHPATFAQDPGNQFLWRMNPRRMESQAIRDSLLHLAGQLDLTPGGPPVDPNPDARRRALYFKHSRDEQNLLLATFDDAEILACYRRSESIVPQQALALSNSKIALEMSAQIASSLAEFADDSAFAAAAFQRILCRKPNPAELAECQEFLKAVPNRSRLVHALVNHNDFVTIR